jgi:hypothetical protein
MKLEMASIDSIEKLDEKIDTSYNGTCFAYSWFLKLKNVDKILKIIYKDKIIGFMPLFLNEEKTGMCQSTMYIPYGGPVLFFVPNEQRNKIRLIRLIEMELALYLKKMFCEFSFSVDDKIIDIMPFIRNGIIPELRYTYKIDLSKDIAEIYNSFGKDRKREIQKATKENISFFLDAKLKYFSCDKCVEWEKKYDFPSSVDFVKKYIKKTIKMDKGMCFLAKKDDFIYGAVYVAWDKTTAYILYSYFDSNYNVGAIAFLYYNIFIFLKEKKDIKFIDFEGSVYESVENFNISFGAYQSRYYNLHYSKKNMKDIANEMYNYFEK